MIFVLNFDGDEMVDKAKRGRPAKVFTNDEFKQILGVIQNISFKTKAQQQLHEMNMSSVSEHHRILDISDLNSEALELLKVVSRQKDVYLKNIEMYKIIQHKSITTIALTQLEKEILVYDLNDRDGFFNCQNALNTYNKLQKIAKNEIKRVESESRQQALKQTLDAQTEGQKIRKERDRHKYFLGGLVQKYEKFLKEAGVYSESFSTTQVLDQLVRDAIHNHAVFLEYNGFDQEIWLDKFDELGNEQ